MNGLAVYPGGHDSGRADLLRRTRERVPVEHHEVGDRARPRPRPASSRWFTHALPEVYAANATSSGSACSGRNGSVPARPGSPYDVRVTAVWIAASGSGVETGQSLPATSRAPARCRAPKGYCQRRPLLPQERQGQVDHLVVVAGPERLHVRGDAELGEPRHVVGVDQLQVGDVVAPGRVGADHRVQRLAHRPVTDGVHVHLEAGGVQGGARRP